MKTIIALFVVAALIPLNCQDKGKDWRGSFLWEGWIGSSYHSQWEIRCDTLCSACVAIDDDDRIPLSRGKYGKIYEKCLGLPKSLGHVDTTEKEVIPLGKVTFSKSSGTKFGFDAWRIGSVTRSPEESYVSVAVEDSTAFNVDLSGNIASSYTRVVAVLPVAAYGKISFNRTEFVDTLMLDSGSNMVKIYANSGNNGDEYCINVYGINDPRNSVCLAGDCYGAEDRLKVVVYKKKIYNNLVLYRVNTPPFDPDTNQWKNEFNKIIKQGVIEVDSFKKLPYSDLSWDKNENGLLDIFVAENDIPADKYETYYLLDALEELGGCASNESSAILVIKGELHSHWVITENVTTGDSVIKLNTIDMLFEGNKITLGPWLGIGSGANEDLYIKRTSESDTTIVVSQDTAGIIMGVRGDHDRHESFWKEYVNGFTLASCSFIKGDPDYQTIVHETLHQVLFGHLFDLDEYPENLMHGYKSSSTGSELWFRKITNVFGLPEWQWSMLHK